MKSPMWWPGPTSSARSSSRRRPVWTGILALELARLGVAVVAVDHSQAMLDATAAKLQAAGARGVELRRGDAADLPLEEASVDAAFAHMVLHYLPSPAEALAEMGRVVKPGGLVVVVDDDWVLHLLLDLLGRDGLGLDLLDLEVLVTGERSRKSCHSRRHPLVARHNGLDRPLLGRQDLVEHGLVTVTHQLPIVGCS